MSMIELAHNSCYADDERNARYRDYEMDMDARDFARNLMVTLTKDEMPISDTEFDEEILDNLAIDPFSDVRGLIALFYRNLWAMANLRETLKKYEDLEEKGLPLGWIPIGEKLPDVDEYIIVSFENFTIPMIGRYTVDDDDSGTFRIGDEDESFVENDLYVNAWMPLPKPYRESEG